MTCGIRSTKKRSQFPCIRGLLKGLNVRSPVFVGGFKAIARIDMFKCPPTSVSRKLPTPKAIRFTMCGNGGQKVEEIENDLASGIRLIGVDTDGNKC